MRAHYEIFKDGEGGWRWRLKAANGEILATSESYTRRADAERAVGDAAAASAEGSVIVEGETIVIESEEE